MAMALAGVFMFVCMHAPLPAMHTIACLRKHIAQIYSHRTNRCDRVRVWQFQCSTSADSQKAKAPLMSDFILFVHAVPIWLAPTAAVEVQAPAWAPGTLAAGQYSR